MRRVESRFSGIGAGPLWRKDRYRDLALADSIYRSDIDRTRRLAGSRFDSLRPTKGVMRYYLAVLGMQEKCDRDDGVRHQKLQTFEPIALSVADDEIHNQD